MNRRNFLFGTIGAAAGGLLLTAPTDSVEIFQPTLAETVAVSRVSRIPDLSAPAFNPFTIGETLFNSRGEPVVIVERITMRRDAEEDVFAGDPWAHHRLGRPSIEVDVRPLFDEFTRRA